MDRSIWDKVDFEKTLRDFDYTKRAVRNMNNAVYSPEFEEEDSEVIFNYLYNTMEMVSFKDYLKRYIYLNTGMDSTEMNGERKAEVQAAFRDIPDSYYKDRLKFYFEENRAPHSLEPTTKKWDAILKSWLTQDSVKRSTVFLLGFGLQMPAEDVSEFLTKVLREEDFRDTDPEEVIYRYCFENALPYDSAKKLMDQYMSSQAEGQGDRPVPKKHNGGKRPGLLEKIVGKNERRKKSAEDEEGYVLHHAADGNGRITFHDEQELLRYLQDLKRVGLQDDRNMRAYDQFEQLVLRAKGIIADIYQKDEEGDNGKMRWTAEDITAGDLERIICNGIPLTKNGNLQKMSASLLSKHFRQKRITRQRIGSLLAHEALVDRFDLITLLFFIYSQEQMDLEPEKRYHNYINEINEILQTCGMMDLYPVNPYETFILMCLLSEYPLGTYSDIWEMSYAQEG